MFVWIDVREWRYVGLVGAGGGSVDLVANKEKLPKRYTN